MSWLSDILGNVAGNFTGSTGVQAATDTRNFLTNLYGDVRGDIYQGLDRQLGELSTGRDSAVAALQGGYAGARAAYAPQMALATEALQGPNQLIQTQAQNTAQLSADAMGLNGPEGIARAQAAFQTGPGFQFALEQGLESVARNTNRGGMIAGGNQLQEAQRYGTGLAQQEYNNWLGRVGQREGLYVPQAAQTGARLADLYAGYGRDISGLGEREGTGLAALYDQNARLRAAAYPTATGQQVQIASNIANPAAQTFGAAANAQAQAGQNIWNLGRDVGLGLFDWLT